MKSRRTINRTLYSLITLLFSFSIAQAEPVTLQLKWKHQFQFAGFYMALEKGFYSTAGFDVQIKEVVVGESAVTQLLEGKADYAVVDPGVLLARAEGAPVKVLSAIFQHSPLTLIVREDSGIKSFADLRGKRIMMVSGLNADIDAALRSAGLSSNDYSRQETSFDIRDLVYGHTDAFAGYETDQPYQLKEMGIAHRILHPREQGIDFYGDLLVSTERLINEQPERVKAFNEASILGWEYALKHIDETIDLIQKKYNSQNLSLKQLKFEALKTREMIASDVVQIGYMRAQRWRDIADVYIKQGLLPEDFSTTAAIYQPEQRFIDILLEHRWQFGMVFLLLLSLFLAVVVTILRRIAIARTARLQESEEQLRLALAAANQAWFDVNVQTGVVKVSPEYAPMIGYEPDEFESSLQNWMEHIHPDDHDQVLAAFQTCLASNQAMAMEYRRQTKLGDWIWIQSIGEVIEWDDSRKPLRMIGIHRDITDQKQAAIALEVSEKKHRLLFKGSENAIVVAHAEDGEIIDCNPAAEVLFGRVRSELIGMRQKELHPPHEHEGEFTTTFNRHKSTKAGNILESEILKPSGEIRQVEIKANLFELEKTKLVQGVFVDITERKQAEEALLQSERSLRQAQATAHIGSWSYDKQGRISWSDELYHIFSVSPDSYVPSTEAIISLIHSDDRSAMQMWMDAIVAGKSPDEIEFRSIRSDGSMIYLRCQGELADDGEKKVIGIIQDITEHKRLEEQFHQAQKMEAVGTLVGGIAHDFNNILAGITGNIYLARQRLQAQPEALHNLESVELLSHRAADLIRQLLTFARKDIVDLKPMPFTPFIKETLKFLRTSLPENITMQQNVCSDALLVQGDATQMHQVLMNLVNNARDAVEGVREPSISVRLERFEPDALFLEEHDYFNDSSYAHISVEDNGCGMSQSQLEHLFEPFFTTKPQGQGTGLGLAMVFGAIKTHKGYVEVESSPDQGSTFHVYLPVTEVIPKVVESVELVEEQGGHGETILLVDDETNIVETGRDVLESLGYKVITALNGEQAVSIFEQHRDEIALCIFDLVMPVMGGYEAAQRIRKLEPKVKIIFATGYDKEGQGDLQNEIVIKKPYAVSQFSQMIRQQLND